MSTVEQLKTLIHSQFDIDPATIDADAPFASYNLDSLTLAELMFAIDDEFKVTVPDSALGEVRTLNELAAVLDKLVQPAAA